MKKWAVLAGLIGLLGLYAWFGIVQPEKAKLKKMDESTLLPGPERLQEIQLATADNSVTLQKRGQAWWVTNPHEYLADQEFVVKAVQIMTETPSADRFPLKEDRYGFKNPSAFFTFIFDDGLNKRIIVGDEEGVGGHVYLLDRDSNEVHVVHNVWSQLLYYPPERLYSKALPISGNQVKSILFSQLTNKVWRLFSGGPKVMKIEYKGKMYESEKAQWLWFFKKIREFELKDLKFNAKRGFEVHSELEIETEKGNIRFQFNKKADKIFIPQLNVFADTDPYSLQSLSDEIDKVINSDKK